MKDPNLELAQEHEDHKKLSLYLLIGGICFAIIIGITLLLFFLLHGNDKPDSGLHCDVCEFDSYTSGCNCTTGVLIYPPDKFTVPANSNFTWDYTALNTVPCGYNTNFNIIYDGVIANSGINGKYTAITARSAGKIKICLYLEYESFKTISDMANYVINIVKISSAGVLGSVADTDKKYIESSQFKLSFSVPVDAGDSIYIYTVSSGDVIYTKNSWLYIAYI